MLGVDTFVVVIERSVSASPAFTDHMAAASAAKHLSGQQVFFLCLGSPRRFLVCFHPSLHPFKYIFFNQCRNAARDDRVAIAVIPDIFPVFQKKRHGTCLEWPVKIVAQASCVQVFHNVLDQLALVVAGENLPHDRGGFWIHDQCPGFFIHGIPIGQCTAVIPAFHCVFPLTTAHFDS